MLCKDLHLAYFGASLYLAPKMYNYLHVTLMIKDQMYQYQIFPFLYSYFYFLAVLGESILTNPLESASLFQEVNDV